MSQPGVTHLSTSPGWTQPPPPHRDSTRTLAIVALVVASVALLGQLLVMAVPMLSFGLLGFGGDILGDEEYDSYGVVTLGGGRVSPAADGTVSAAALTTAVRELVGFEDPYLPPAEQISCDAAPRVALDVSVLCRATPEQWYFIVRFVNGSGAFEVIEVETGDMMEMP